MFKKQCQVKIEKMNFNKKHRKNLKRKTENFKNVLQIIIHWVLLRVNYVLMRIKYLKESKGDGQMERGSSAAGARQLQIIKVSIDSNYFQEGGGE